jgi:dienelactone hydrolase
MSIRKVMTLAGLTLLVAVIGGRRQRRMAALRRALLGTLVLLALAPASAVRAQVPFPTNLLTTPDSSQLTGVRVNLPKPDCATQAGTCADIDVLNGLDGFNVQPRISIPFDGPIDVSTVSNATVHLLDTSCPACAPVGINQVVWEPSASTLHFESDQLLKQHTTYLLVATTGLKDDGGQAVDRTTFQRELNFGQTGSAASRAYRKALIDALDAAGVDLEQVAAASLFTTQSVTADLEKIRREIDGSSPGPASILGSFDRSSVSGIVFCRQTSTTSPCSSSAVPLAALDVFPGSVGKIVFGRYESPDYETAAKVIPATGTDTGSPARQGTNQVYFNLFLPSGPRPAGGWPVAIFGHGFTDNKNSSPFAVASTMAKAGIATIAINVVGHGGGPDGTLTVNRSDGSSVTIPAGGRGIDQNGDTRIDSTEGVSAAPPFDLVSNRDGLRQTVVDLMQLVREIQVGVDVDGPALDPSRIYYFGQSFGGIYGVDFVAVEPDVAAGVPNVPGGSVVEISRLGSFRPLLGLALLTHVPSLYNVVPNPTLTNFIENMPLRNLTPIVDTVPGASAIQEYLDRREWAQESASPPAYAPHLRARPLAGVAAKSVIVQFAKGDQTVPNPTATAIIRAGDLTDRTTYFRNDLAFAADPSFPKNPHSFLTGLSSPCLAPCVVALQAQGQIATFFSSNGAVTTDPDGAGALFETPTAGPLPEGLNFIP